MTASILPFHLRHQLILLQTIMSLPGAEATLSVSYTIPTTQLLFPVVLGTIAMKSAKTLMSVSKTY